MDRGEGTASCSASKLTLLSALALPQSLLSSVLNILAAPNLGSCCVYERRWLGRSNSSERAVTIIWTGWVLAANPGAWCSGKGLD